MHRSLLIAADGGIERVDETLYELNLGSTAPEVMVAELELLVSGLAPSITLRHRSNKLKINVSCGDTIDLPPDGSILSFGAQEWRSQE